MVASRRHLLRAAGAGFAGGSAALLAACGGGAAKPKGGTQSSRADVEILNRVLDLENTAIAAYTAGAPLLKGDLIRVARQFLSHEKEHADALARAVTQAGGKPKRPRFNYSFPSLRSQTDVLRFAERIENGAIAAYVDALPRLSNADVRATVAEIVTTDAEHLAVIRGTLGEPKAPGAFVVSRAP